MPENPEQTTHSRPSTAAAAADQVASIVAAAEQSVQRMIQQTEERVRDRIAEGERAAQNRVQAGEEEAVDIVAAARAEAEKLVNDATGEALTIVARAQENADAVVKDAAASAIRERDEAYKKARDLLRDSRSVASDVRTQGMELVDNLRDMGDSLRSNAERLLRDVQAIHSQMVSKIDNVETTLGLAPRTGPERPTRTAARDAVGGSENGDALDVPEFIPPP